MHAPCPAPTRATPLPAATQVSPDWIAEVRARTPSGTCSHCGEPIGAARLTLHPGTSYCAWCAPPSSALDPGQGAGEPDPGC